MRLTPHELDKLVVHQAGVLAQKRLARGVRLNHPECVALIAAQLLEFIRDGRSVAELMDLGRRFLGRADVLEGVPELVDEVQIEGTFPDGTKLVTVHNPIVAEEGDLELALYGSFLPVPRTRGTREAPSGEVPGELFTGTAEITLNEGRTTETLAVTNTGDRPIQVGSHYHFIECNRALSFDRSKSYGLRLDIPAGTAVRFEPGETKTVGLVEIGGKRVIRGGSSMADGEVNEAGRAKAMANVAAHGFANVKEGK